MVGASCAYHDGMTASHPVMMSAKGVKKKAAIIFNLIYKIDFQLFIKSKMFF